MYYLTVALQLTGEMRGPKYSARLGTKVYLWNNNNNNNNNNNEAPKVRTLSAIKHYLAITI